MKEFHEVANIFPLMVGVEFDRLKADIADNGQHEAIWLHPDGRIIDGRNRYNACVDLGIEPEYRTWDGTGSLVTFVISYNLHRRQMNSGQLAMVALNILPMLEAEARERQGTRTDLAKDNIVAKLPQCSEVDPPAPKSRDTAAKMMGVSPRYVSDAKRIADEAPELAERVMAGTQTLVAAKRELKERSRERRRKENKEKAEAVTSPAAAITDGVQFATILLDPPWDWGDEKDVNQLGRAKPDYVTMPIEELAALPVSDLADVDCHIYMWITNRSLPKGFALLEGWGFRYITCITWVKPSFGMGNYFRGQTEHVLFGVKGSQPLKRKDMGTFFNAERGDNGHSSKPSEIYDIIESCSPGPYLEMFSRVQRDGWTAWGADSNDT